MKRFEYSAVKSRLTERMKMNSESATILDDGAFSNLLDVFSEGISEIGRYVEYNTLEKKWTTAANMTSLTTMGGLIGRKRERPKSSIGFIVVSHTDEKGVNRLQNYGSTFFDLDEKSNYDNIVEDPDANYIEKSALVPWTNPLVYEVPKGTIFTANNGTQFISTKSVKTRLLTKPYKDIDNNEIRKEEFVSAGGWDGIKYLKIPVIQGIQKEQELGVTKGTRFESYKLNASNVENASNNISKDYFYIEVTPPGAEESERWVEIPKIRLAGPYDKVYETKLSEDGESVIVKFGDGISGYLPVKGSRIVVHYLETLGSAGNIEQKFQINKMAFPDNSLMIDPRTNTVSSFLSCVNTTSIMGGKDIEDEDQYKTNAPTTYLNSYTTAVKSVYEKQIMNNSPVSLSKLVCYPSSSFDAQQVDLSLDTDIDEEVANEVNIISNALCVSAIKANGDMITAKESKEFIKTVIKSIGDNKGPNDSLTYVEPNFIKIAPSIKINTYDIDISESEIQKNINTAVSSEYSIFNTNFKSPLYSSRILYYASLFKFTDSASLMLEALANVSFETEDIKVMCLSYYDKYSGKSTNKPVVAIPFGFDKVFASDQYNLGFKNAFVEAPYLLKADLKFINTDAATEKARTFFLFDNRVDTEDTLESAFNKDVENKNFAKDTAVIKNDKENLGTTVTFFDETTDSYTKRQVRVAQFPYITNITDSTFMGKAKSFNTAPFENRRYEIDTTGKNKVFNSIDVEYEYRVSFSGIRGTDAVNCYKWNKDYIDYVTIIFNENYDDPESTDYANGYFIIPVEYFGFDGLPTWNDTTPNETNYVQALSARLKNYISLKVYAEPKQMDIEPSVSNDICFIDDDDIKVEKVLKYKD